MGAIVACFIMHDALRKLFSVVMKDRDIFFIDKSTEIVLLDPISYIWGTRDYSLF